jgi:hypothetical protein
MIARDSAGLRELWLSIEALDNRVPATAQYEALLATRDYVEQLTRRLLLQRTPRQQVDIGAEVARLTPAFQTLERLLPAALPGIAAITPGNLRPAADRRHSQPLANRLAGLMALRATPTWLRSPSRCAGHCRGRAAVFSDRCSTGIDWLAKDSPAANHEHRRPWPGNDCIRRSSTDSAIWPRALRERRRRAAVSGSNDGGRQVSNGSTLRELRASAARISPH